MSKGHEPPDKVKCYVCKKKINLAAKRKLKKVNGSGRNALSKIHQLRDGNYVCSDACFNLAVNPPIEPVGLGPE